MLNLIPFFSQHIFSCLFLKNPEDFLSGLNFLYSHEFKFLFALLLKVSLFADFYFQKFLKECRPMPEGKFRPLKGDLLESCDIFLKFFKKMLT